MANDQSNQSLSPLDSSSSLSIVSALPLPPPGPMFARLLALAFEHGVIKQETLRDKLPIKEVLEVALQDKERALGIYLHVMMMEGPFAEKFAARLDLERMTADVTLAVSIDADAASRLKRELTFDIDFFLKHIPFGDIYSAVMVSLIKEDSRENRLCVAKLCEAMVEYQAFGMQHETERNIMKAIGLDVLFGDKVPSVLHARMVTAVYRGGQKFKDEHRPMYAYLFEKFVGGVSFSELAEHLSVGMLVRPFGVYVNRLGLVRTSVEKPTGFPPSDDSIMPDLSSLALPAVPRVPLPEPTTSSPSDSPALDVRPATNEEAAEIKDLEETP